MQTLAGANLNPPERTAVIQCQLMEIIPKWYHSIWPLSYVSLKILEDVTRMFRQYFQRTQVLQWIVVLYHRFREAATVYGHRGTEHQAHENKLDWSDKLDPVKRVCDSRTLWKYDIGDHSSESRVVMGSIEIITQHLNILYMVLRQLVFYASIGSRPKCYRT